MFSKFFAFLFIVSLSIFLFFWFNPAEAESKISKSTPQTQSYQKTTPTINVEANLVSDIFDDSQFMMMASLVTSLFSFLGFLFSLKSTYKEDKLLDLKREREQLEMEKLKAEIDLLKERNR